MRLAARLRRHDIKIPRPFNYLNMIYFIRSGKNGPLKIEYTDEDIEKKLESLQEGNPHELKLVAIVEGDQSQMSGFHRRFQRYHIRGEWYQPDREIIGYIFQNQRQDFSDIAQGINLHELLETVERQYIKEALDLTSWNREEAAKLLSITFRSIRYKIKKFNIEKY